MISSARELQEMEKWLVKNEEIPCVVGERGEE